MADAFPNKEQEDTDAKIDKSVKNILQSVEKHWGTTTVAEGEDKALDTVSKYWTDEKDVFSGDRKYINSLLPEYKNKVLRYLDIFKENPDLVTEYLQTLKEFGTEKKAKESGATNVLFYPNKVKKFLKEHADVFTEGTDERWNYYYDAGAHNYDIKVREDKWAKKYQKEWLGKFSTKVSLGVSEAGMDSARSFSKLIAQIIDKVGPDNAKSAVDYIEANWPKADDYSYPNKLRPFDQDSAMQHLADEVTQFGIDIWTGGRLVKLMGAGFKKVAPGQFKKLTDWATAKAPVKTKAGKEVADSFGNIKYASSIAQRFGYWGTAAKYGIGRSIADDEEHTTFVEGFGLVPPMDRKRWDKMTKRERAVYGLKRRLIHGGEGTLLIGGLTKAIGWTGSAIMGNRKSCW